MFFVRWNVLNFQQFGGDINSYCSNCNIIIEIVIEIFDLEFVRVLASYSIFEISNRIQISYIYISYSIYIYHKRP